MGGAVRVGASFAWRTGSASELPWKIKKQNTWRLKLNLENKDAAKFIRNQIIIS